MLPDTEKVVKISQFGVRGDWATNLSLRSKKWKFLNLSNNSYIAKIDNIMLYTGTRSLQAQEAARYLKECWEKLKNEFHAYYIKYVN